MNRSGAINLAPLFFQSVLHHIKISSALFFSFIFRDVRAIGADGLDASDKVSAISDTFSPTPATATPDIPGCSRVRESLAGIGATVMKQQFGQV